MSRVKQNLPKDPKKFGAVMTRLLKNSTQQQRDALADLGLDVDSKQMKERTALRKVTEALITKEAPQNRTEDKRHIKRAVIASLSTLKKYRLMRAASRHKRIVEVSHEASERTDNNRKTRNDTLNENVVDRVKSFYQDAEVSIILPNISKQQDNPDHIMDITINDAYNKFQESHPEDKISRSKFAKHCPSHVRTQRHRKLIQCLCEYCTNVEEMIKAADKQCGAVGHPESKVRNRYNAVSLTMCPKLPSEKYHNIDCIKRNCQHCGVYKLRDYFGDAVAASRDEEISFYMWVNE